MQSEAALVEAAISIDETAIRGQFEVEFIRDDFDCPEAHAASLGGARYRRSFHIDCLRAVRFPQPGFLSYACDDVQAEQRAFSLGNVHTAAVIAIDHVRWVKN